MRSKHKIDTYVNEVGNYIRWEKARADVAEELREHIIDRKDMYIAQGMDEETAAIQAVAHMGSAAELGKELNRANRPAPEWAKGNVFIQSSLRQPVRTVFLFLLVCLISFAFVLRGTEFLVVRDRIHEIGGFYRSIGFLRMDGEMYANIITGAEVIAGSSFALTEDRRRGAEAVLHDKLNADIRGFRFFETNYPRSERLHFTFFYAELIQMDYIRGGSAVRLRLRVDDVAVGFPEHAAAGYNVTMHMHIPDDGENPLAGLEVGQRYFFKGAHYLFHEIDGFFGRRPTVGGTLDRLYMYPLNDYGLWYVPVPFGEVDPNTPGLEGLDGEIERMRYNHSVLWLRTTSGMEAMPQVHMDIFTLHGGRFLTRDDYINKNPVVVIHYLFAETRGLATSDTITISVPANQRVVAPRWGFFTEHFGPGVENIRFQDGYVEFFIHGDPTEYIVSGLELEIVGIFDKHARWEPNFDNLIYIPDSLLPDDFKLVDEIHGYDDFLWDVWYSFELANPRNESAFLLENRDVLASRGITLTLLPTGAANYWLTAEPVLQSITVNFIVFSIMSALVLGFVTFLYMYQRRKDLVILRLLGSPIRSVIRKLCTPILFFGFLSMITGGIIGWFIALKGAENIMGDMVMGYDIGFGLPLYWFAVMVGASFIFMLAAVYLGALLIAKRPVLVLLQGGGSKRVKRR
ncbi:MAG: ABC transporter permease [Defluviitaleaceae bacterium]|nr:ABC transporter permease [Defluviitaleaceae bacterium]